jgi:hypothetical protein
VETRPLPIVLGDADDYHCRFLELLEEFKFEITLNGTLARGNGSIHLHLRPHSEKKGVLEYTLDPTIREAWLSWQSNRFQPWVPVLAEQLAIRFHERIAT